MSVWVVDASVAAKWYLTEPGSDLATNLLGAGNDLIGPDLVLIELATTFSRRVRRQEMLRIDAAKALQDAMRSFTEIVRSQALLDDAFHLSIVLKHPLPDCIYLALAMSRGAQLVTADQVFLASLEGTAFAPHALPLATPS